MKQNEFKANEHLREDTQSFAIMVFNNGKTEPYFITKALFDEFTSEFGQDVKDKHFVETWVSSKKM